MKRNFFLALVLCAVLPALAAGREKPSLRYVDAATLNVIGHPKPVTHPFMRVEGFDFGERGINAKCRMSTGLAVVFRTDSRTLAARWKTEALSLGANGSAVMQKGLDLYIRRDGRWIFAASGRPDMRGEMCKHACTLLSTMPEGEKECLLYLPLFSVVESLEIGVDADASLTGMENPFRHRIVVAGSSITHGAAAGRSGMCYVARLERMTGLYCMNFGFSGEFKLQPALAEYLAGVEADAFVFDAFSNPNAEQIHGRFAAFVARLRESHPDTPLVFLQTERRETRNFNLGTDRFEQARQDAAREEVFAAMKHDKRLYFIDSVDFLGDDSLGTTDGTHPNDLGFDRMARAIAPKLMKILRKYGIK